MIKLTDIHKNFGKLNVLDRINMTFENESITSILGPSGCGKTTLLSITAGLIKPDSGSVTGLDDKKPGFLFQETRLLPWKTAVENLEFVLSETIGKDSGRQMCMEILKKVGLNGYENHYPSQLSGGMNQRLAMARAFIVKSDVLFMDEPFQSLDIKRRSQMISLLKSLWISNKPAIIMVTHDVQEALLLSDKIYILSDKPAKILVEFKNPMPFNLRSTKNEDFYRLEHQILNEYVLKD